MRHASSKPFTLRDVARLAGVSVGTVSAVLNNKDSVSAESRRRTEEVMNQLGYRPDSLARGLRTGRSYVVGFVVPDVTNPFFTEAMGGLESMARSHGYSVILSNSNENSEQESQNLDLLQSRRVDGVVLACSSGRIAQERLSDRRFPIVFLDRLPFAGFSGRAVIVDNTGGAYAATKHLIELGHTKIAIIAGLLDLSVGAERLAGFRKAMEKAHLPVREEYFQVGDFHPESGYRCGMSLMALPDPPTAIFACNNSMTLGLMRALTESKAPCPEQVSVLAFDDFPWAAHFRPQMTAVAQPVFELGRQAMRMLLAAMEPESQEASEIEERLIVLPTELRVRQSTSQPPKPKGA